MFARYYSAGHSRFLAVDPLSSSARPAVPQTWNRYSYVRNNPILRVDPDGMEDTVYLQYSPDYNRGRGSPSARAVADGVRQANDKFKRAGSSVRVQAMTTDVELDASDRVATMVSGSHPDGRVLGEASEGGPITLYMDEMISDNLDTEQNEAANGFGNVLAHEVGHTYGIEFDYETAHQRPNGTLDLDHAEDPDDVMSPSASKTPQDFSQEAGDQLPKKKDPE